MGELSSKELAEDLTDFWKESGLDTPLHRYLLLTPREWESWQNSHILPPDFERRHGQ